MTRSIRIGIVGVGTIAEAIVEGVCTVPGSKAEFVLTPRSASRSASLAARFPNVHVAASNQAVLDQCDVVLIAVLPSQVEAVCASLTFRADHVVGSLVGGWPPSRLPTLLSPATTICQIVPLPMIRMHVGPIVLFPHIDAVADVFHGCGDIVVPDSESELAVLAAGSATMSSFFAIQCELADWLSGRGIEPAVAWRYVSALFHGLALTGTRTDADDAHSLITEHETPRGFNEQVRTGMQRAGAVHALSDELDRLLKERFGR